MIFQVLGNILIAISVVFTFLGLIGVFRFKDFYSKLMASSKIDTLALVTLIIGVSLRSGLSWFTLKAWLILIVILCINPIITSKIALNAREEELQNELEKKRSDVHS